MAMEGENTPLVVSTSETFLKRIKSRRYDAFNRVSKRFKGGDGNGEAIEDVLRDMENSERLNGKIYGGAVFAILAHVVIGITMMRWLEGWSFYDAVYFCVVTTTTVGYGDITPTRNVSKAFVIYYVFASIGIISTMLAYVIGTLIDRQEELLLQALGGDEESDEEQLETGRQSESVLDKADVHELAVSVFWLVVILSVGVLVFWRIEKLSLLNATYVTIISASTVGFGDLQPTRNSSKLAMTVWLCFATIWAAKVVGEVAGTFAKMKQKSATRRLMGATMDMKSLMRMDKDQDRRVDRCEFLAQMLIRTGKVSDEDVQPLLKRFAQLDRDSSGFITMDEVT